MTNTSRNTPLIVALDVASKDAALALARQLDPTICRLKIGKELFTYCGPDVVEQVQKLGFDVFLDLKFHDIPNTTAQAVKAAASLGVWMVNVHTSGGLEMMQKCREVLESISSPPLLIGVTVLTSMDAHSLAGIGISRSPNEQVAILAQLAREAGLDGVVASAREASDIKTLCGRDFITVTPGIRPLDSAADDQKRTMTPVEAIEHGSDYLVIGRPITKAAKPNEAASKIFQELR